MGAGRGARAKAGRHFFFVFILPPCYLAPPRTPTTLTAPSCYSMLPSPEYDDGVGPRRPAGCPVGWKRPPRSNRTKLLTNATTHSTALHAHPCKRPCHLSLLPRFAADAGIIFGNGGEAGGWLCSFLKARAMRGLCAVCAWQTARAGWRRGCGSGKSDRGRCCARGGTHRLAGRKVLARRLQRVCVQWS